MRVLFHRKKALAILLALTILVSLATAALAAPEGDRPPEPLSGEMPTPPDGQRPGGDMPTPPDGQAPGAPPSGGPGGSFDANS